MKPLGKVTFFPVDVRARQTERGCKIDSQPRMGSSIVDASAVQIRASPRAAIRDPAGKVPTVIAGSGRQLAPCLVTGRRSADREIIQFGFTARTTTIGDRQQHTVAANRVERKHRDLHGRRATIINIPQPGSDIATELAGESRGERRMSLKWSGRKSRDRCVAHNDTADLRFLVTASVAKGDQTHRTGSGRGICVSRLLFGSGAVVAELPGQNTVRTEPQRKFTNRGHAQNARR